MPDRNQEYGTSYSTGSSEAGSPLDPAVLSRLDAMAKDLEADSASQPLLTPDATTGETVPGAEAPAVLLDASATNESEPSKTTVESRKEVRRLEEAAITSQALEDLERKYSGLTEEQIRADIKQYFFEDGRIKYPDGSNERNSSPAGVGENTYEVARNSILYNRARRLQKSHSNYAKQKTANIDQARKRVNKDYEKNALSIDRFNEALSVAEIKKLTSYWVDRGYVTASKDETGKIVYATPKSAQLDKGKLMTGNSILDYREEALARLASKKPSNRAESNRPAFSEHAKSSALENLINLEPFDAQREGDSIEQRLSFLHLATQEAGDDSDKLGLVMGQAFRQGLVERRNHRDEETGRKWIEFIGASPEISEWYKGALDRNNPYLSRATVEFSTKHPEMISTDETDKVAVAAGPESSTSEPPVAEEPVKGPEAPRSETVAPIVLTPVPKPERSTNRERWDKLVAKQQSSSSAVENMSSDGLLNEYNRLAPKLKTYHLGPIHATPGAYRIDRLFRYQNIRSELKKREQHSRDPFTG